MPRNFLGKRHTQETIEKIRNSKLKNPCRYWLGKKRPPFKWSEEARARIRGKNSPLYKEKIKLVCKCGNSFYVNEARLKTAKFCSYRCNATGRKPSEETKIRMSEAAKRNGNTPGAWWRGKKRSLKDRLQISVRNKGVNSPNWRGGISPINKRLRLSLDFKLWREAVFKRDNWTCVICKNRGGVLHPDHIKMFAFHKELRFVVENGRTLCEGCHMSLPTSRSRKHLCCEL